MEEVPESLDCLDPSLFCDEHRAALEVLNMRVALSPQARKHFEDEMVVAFAGYCPGCNARGLREFMERANQFLIEKMEREAQDVQD